MSREICFGLAASLVAASAGLALDSLSNARGLAAPGMALASLAAGFAHCIFLFVLAWAPARSIARLLGLAPHAAAAAVGAGLVCYLAAAPTLGAPVTLAAAAQPLEGKREAAALAAVCALAAAAVLAVVNRREAAAIDRGAVTVAAVALAAAVLTWGGVFDRFPAACASVLALAAAVWAGRGLTGRRLAAALAAACAAFLLAGAWTTASALRLSEPPRVVGAAGGKPNLILITFDTLRADEVNGPAFDDFASQSAVFENAYSSGGWTSPGMASLLSGVCPDVHGLGPAVRPLPDALPTLADRLRSGGYRTASFGMNVVARGLRIPERFQQEAWHPPAPFGLSAGPETLERLVPGFRRRASPETLTREALAWLDGGPPQPFFLWLHYYDPHGPFTPPGRFREESSEEPDLREQWRKGFARRLQAGESVKLSAAARRRLRALYRGEVAWVDENLGAVLSHLREKGLFESSWVALSSDHGEEFFDHGGFEHGHTLYDELLRVPLMIKPPGEAAPRRFRTAVSTASVTPTLLDALASLDTAEHGSPSLLGAIERGEEPDAAPLFASGVRFIEDRHAVLFDGYKYIRGDVSGLEELYNLTRDPGEGQPLDDPPMLERGRQLLSEHLEAAGRLRERYGAGRPPALDAASRDLLESLGYVQ